jgi:hypothetical protein
MEMLSIKEKESLMLISSAYVKVHKEIIKVEETMRRMEKRSADLITKLEECRSKEKVFVSELKNKYGEGILDPMDLSWKKKEANDTVPQ